MMFLMLLLSLAPIVDNFFPDNSLTSIFSHLLLVIVTVNLILAEKLRKTFFPLLIVAVVYGQSLVGAISRGHSPLWLFIGTLDNLKTIVPMLLLLSLPDNYFTPKKSDVLFSKIFGLILIVSLFGAVLSQFSVRVREFLDFAHTREMVRYGVIRTSSIYINVNMFVKMTLVSFLGFSVRGFRVWLALLLWGVVSGLTYSRQFILGTILSMMAGFSASGIKAKLKKKNLPPIIVAISGVIIFFSISLVNSEQSNFSEADGRLNNLTDGVLRIGVFYSSFNCAMQYPFGVGPSNFGGNIGKKLENNEYLFECGVREVFPLFDLARHYTDSQFAEMLGSLGFGSIAIFLIFFYFVLRLGRTYGSRGRFLVYSASIFIGIQFLVSPILNYFEFILPFIFLLRKLIRFSESQEKVV